MTTPCSVCECGDFVAAGEARFCTDCGHSLDEHVAEPDSCPSCGEPIEAGFRFCGACGESIRVAANTQPPTPASPVRVSKARSRRLDEQVQRRARLSKGITWRWGVGIGVVVMLGLGVALAVSALLSGASPPRVLGEDELEREIGSYAVSYFEEQGVEIEEVSCAPNWGNADELYLHRCTVLAESGDSFCDASDFRGTGSLDVSFTCAELQHYNAAEARNDTLVRNAIAAINGNSTARSVLAGPQFADAVVGLGSGGNAVCTISRPDMPSEAIAVELAKVVDAGTTVAALVVRYTVNPSGGVWQKFDFKYGYTVGEPDFWVASCSLGYDGSLSVDTDLWRVALANRVDAASTSGAADGTQATPTDQAAPPSDLGGDFESNDAAREAARRLLADSPPILDLGTNEHSELLEACYAAAHQATLDSGRAVNQVSWERGCRAAAEDVIRKTAEEGKTGRVYMPDNWAHDPASRSEKPTIISNGTGNWFDDLTWTGWGSSRAVGEGLEHTTGCGSCPEQPGSPAPVKFVLSQPGLCQGRMYYLGIRIEHADGRVQSLTVKPQPGTVCALAAG